MEDFKDKVVWITGASSGIGESIAKECARRGARLILSARRQDQLERVASETGLAGDAVMIITMDMERYEEFSGIVRKVLNRYGRVDYLFSNAGVSSRALAIETPVALDKKLMDINYMGHVALTKAIIPSMLKEGKGHIVVTSSVNAKIGIPERSAIAAPKHALHGFYNTLREELWDNNIKITIVIPGYVRTNISVNALTASGKKYNKRSKYMAAGMTPEALARKILKAVSKGRREVRFGGSEILAIYLQQIFPGMLSRKLRKMHAANKLDE